MGRKDKEILEKKKRFEEDNGIIKPLPYENKTPINKIQTTFMGNVKVFQYFEELHYHVSCLNPSLLRDFRNEQKSFLKINGIGRKVKIKFL